LFVLSLLLVSGCGIEKKKTHLEIGREYFEASDYEKAMVRFEKWVSNKKNPNLIEAYAMLAVIYHDYNNRETEFRNTLEELKRAGEPGMAAVLRLMENKTVGERLENTINDILVQGGSLSVGPLIANLQSANWRLKTSAQKALIAMGTTAVDGLINVLNDPDPYTRSIVLEALSKIGDRRSISALESKLSDPSKFVQVTAAAGLHSMGQTGHEKTIVDALEYPSPETRAAAAKAASEYLSNPPVAPLLKLLRDTDASVRNYAAQAIGKTKSVEAVPILVKAVRDDKDEQVKNSAAKALESIGAPSVEPLSELLKNTKDMELIVRVAHTLGNIGDRKAVDPLEAVYKRETRPLIKNEVAKALNKIE